MTGPMIIDFFKAASQYQKLSILELLDKEELRNIFSMPTEAMVTFLNSMMLDMKDFRNDHLRMETASLNSFPYYAVSNFL